MTIKKYGDKTKLCYIDTVSLIVSVKLEGAYADFAEDEKKFVTSNFKVERSLPIGKTKK